VKDAERLCEIFWIQDCLPNGKNAPGCVWTYSVGCKIIWGKNKFIATIFKTDLNLCQSSRCCNSFAVKWQTLYGATACRVSFLKNHQLLSLIFWTLGQSRINSFAQQRRYLSLYMFYVLWSRNFEYLPIISLWLLWVCPTV